MLQSFKHFYLDTQCSNAVNYDSRLQWMPDKSRNMSDEVIKYLENIQKSEEMIKLTPEYLDLYKKSNINNP